MSNVNDRISAILEECKIFLDFDYPLNNVTCDISRLWELTICKNLIDSSLAIKKKTKKRNAGPDFVIQNYPESNHITGIECISVNRENQNIKINKTYVQLKILGAVKDKIFTKQGLNQFDKWEKLHNKKIQYKILALNTGALDFPFANIGYLLGEREDYFVKDDNNVSHETIYTPYKSKTRNGKLIDPIQFYDDFLSKFNAIVFCNCKPFFQHVSSKYYEFIYRDKDSELLKIENIFKWIP